MKRAQSLICAFSPSLPNKTPMHTPTLLLGAAFALTSPSLALQELPKIEQAQFRTDIPMPQGRAILELETRGATMSQFRVNIDGQPFTFADDGLQFDRKRRDGVYTALIPADLQAESRVAKKLLKGLQQDVPVAVFEGRRRDRVVRSSRLIPHRRPHALPLINTSVSTTVKVENSLAITDPSVLEEYDQYTYDPCSEVGTPMGAWTFGHLMTELAGSMNPSDFTIEWLGAWASDQSINGFNVPERDWVVDQVLAAWPLDGNGDLDMAQAPFRNTGIFLRLDLRTAGGYSAGNAGEARFVFSLMDGACNGRKFLTIFEYGINKGTCARRQWGQDWADLSDLALGSSAYNDALAALTTQFTDQTSNPNANVLNQLRTNEFLNPGGSDWELREFRLNDFGILAMDTVKLTPDLTFNNGILLGNVMNDADPDFPVSILAGSSITPFGFFWNAPNVLSSDLRHDVSLNTCNGCHMGETQTLFTHVAEAGVGDAVNLSDFLTGGDSTPPYDPLAVHEVPDAAGAAVDDREFNDLERRRQDLQNLIDSSCLSQILEVPVDFVH